MIIGYARVSTDGQTLDAQQASLKAAGADRVYSEKISGAVSDRKQLAKAITALGLGDVLLVTRLDRLARSTRDLLNVLATNHRKRRRVQIAQRANDRYYVGAWPLGNQHPGCDWGVRA